MQWPEQLEVVVEVPRLGFIKRRDDGGVDYVSPLPCPFNYGSVPGTVSGDGDREDAVLLGPRRPRGHQVSAPVLARVDFVDAGQPDPKWVCGVGPLSTRDRWLVAVFFGFYARAKSLLNAARGKRGPTRYAGLALRTASEL